MSNKSVVDRKGRGGEMEKDLPGGQRQCPEAVFVVAVPADEAAEVKVEEVRSLRTRRTVWSRALLFRDQ